MNTWVPMQVGKFLVMTGIALVVVGLLVMLVSKLSLFGLGRLPGYIAFRGKNVSFYFPIVSCLLLSILMTLLFWLFSLFTRR